MYPPIIPLILCLSFISELSAETIKVCYDHYPPSTIFTTNESKNRGFSIDLITHIFEKKGFTVGYLEAPYARSLKMVESGYCDIQGEATRDMNLEGILYPNEGTYTAVYSAYTGQDNPIMVNEISGLKGLRIASISGYRYALINMQYHEFLQQVNKKNLTILTGDQAPGRVLEMLSFQRVDIFVESDLLVENFIKENPHVKVRKLFSIGKLLPYPGFSKSSKRSRKLMEIWDKGRAEARRSGLDLYIKKKSLESDLR